MTRFGFALSCLLLSAIALPLAGSAQTPPPAQPAAQQGGGLGFSNSGGPIDITADHNENFQQQHLSVWSGHVVAIQGEDTLETPRLQVWFADSGAKTSTPTPAPAPAPGVGPTEGGKIKHMEADGPVYFITQTQKARGDHGVYEAEGDTITLIGNVVLVQDKNVVKGEKLVIEQKTGHSTLYATPTGQGGRVRGIFYQNDSTAAKPGAKPAPGASASPQTR